MLLYEGVSMPSHRVILLLQITSQPRLHASRTHVIRTFQIVPGITGTAAPHHIADNRIHFADIARKASHGFKRDEDMAIWTHCFVKRLAFSLFPDFSFNFLTLFTFCLHLDHEFGLYPFPHLRLKFCLAFCFLPCLVLCLFLCLSFLERVIVCPGSKMGGLL